MVKASDGSTVQPKYSYRTILLPLASYTAAASTSPRTAQPGAVERPLRSRADSEEHQWAFFCTARTDTATVVTRGQRHLEGAWSLSPLSMRDHHGIRCGRRSSRAPERGKDRWSQDALQAQRHLGASSKDSRSITPCESWHSSISESTASCADVTWWPPTYGVDCLWSSAAAVLRTHSIEDCVRCVISLGNDTDTTACVAGGWAGPLYSVEAIPLRWH